MRKVSAAFVSLLFSSVALAQSAARPPGTAPPPPPARPYDAIVAHFESHGETPLEALLRLGMENKVALGIVRTDNRLCNNVEDVTIDNQPVLKTANTLLKNIDGYQAVVRDGVIIIEPRTASPNSGQILNLVIGQYVSQEGSSMQALGVYLWRYVYDILHPEASTMTDILSGEIVPIPPFEMHNATVEQILNRIVKEGGGGVWVLPPIPDDYRNKRDFRFVDVSSYIDDVEKISTTSCAFVQVATTGSVEGVVVDQQGIPIPNMDIDVYRQEDMQTRAGSAKTDSAGKFVVHDLPAELILIYAFKEKDGYLRGFSNFNSVPNDNSLVGVKVEAGQTATTTIKRKAMGAYLKVNASDENGHRLFYAATLRRDDQPGQFWRESMAPGDKLQVPAVPFRLEVQSPGYADWHYGGANYGGKAGLITLKPGQTLSLDVRLRKK